MKVVFITTILIITFFFGALYFTHYVNVNADKLLIAIEKLDDAILIEDWDTAREELNIIKENWNEVKPLFETFLEHFDIDVINVSLEKIEKFLEVEERNLTLGEVTQLKFIINLIKKREELSLTNLL